MLLRIGHFVVATLKFENLFTPIALSLISRLKLERRHHRSGAPILIAEWHTYHRRRALINRRIFYWALHRGSKKANQKGSPEKFLFRLTIGFVVAVIAQFLVL